MYVDHTIDLTMMKSRDLSDPREIRSQEHVHVSQAPRATFGFFPIYQNIMVMELQCIHIYLCVYMVHIQFIYEYVYVQ